MPQKNGDFEFKLGRFGLIFFTLIIALLLLFFFVCGVMVGKNIESYPQKIARDIPGAIKQSIIENRDIPADQDKKEDDFEFTFYDTLKGTQQDKQKPFAGMDKEKPPAKHKPPAKEQRGGQYVIQIASFKDKNRTEALKTKLSAMGYSPTVDEIDLHSRGKWFRVKLHGFAGYDDAKKIASLLEEKLPGIKCLILENKKSG